MGDIDVGYFIKYRAMTYRRQNNYGDPLPCLLSGDVCFC